VLIGVLVVAGCLLLYSIFHSMRSNKVTELSYSDLMNRVNNKEVATAVVEPDNISGQLTDETRYSSRFYGRFAQYRGYSKDTAIKIDQEVNHIIMERYGRALRIITAEYGAVERLAQALLEREPINAIQIGRIVVGLPLDDDRV
jgi:ATP-dependent Zn protease